MKLGKAISFSIFSAYAEQIIGLISVVIITRMLTPDEIGLFAIAISLFAIVSQLRVLGVSAYIIREKDLTEDKIRGSYGVLIILSWTIGILIIVLSGAIDRFYAKENLQDLIIILSLGYFIAPYSNLVAAILSRDLAFDKIFNLHIITALARLFSTVLLIYMGYSYYSLAIGMVFGSFIQFFLCIRYRTIPLLILPSTHKFKEIVTAGLFITVTSLTKLLSSNIPDLVLGKLKTLSDVAYFSRGLGLILFAEKLLVKSISPVILPHFSREMHNNDKSIASLYSNALSLLSMIVLPIYAAINVLAYTLIVIMFGDQWIFVVEIASVLALWAMFISIHAFLHPALISIGLEKNLFQKDIVIFMINIVIFIYAARYSLVFLAWAVVLSGFIEFIINSYYARLKIGLSYRQLIKSLSPSLFTAALCWFITYSLTFVIDIRTELFLTIIVYSIVLPVCWLIIAMLLKHEIYFMIKRIINNYI